MKRSLLPLLLVLALLAGPPAGRRSGRATAQGVTNAGTKYLELEG